MFSHFYLHGIFDCTTTYFGRYEILFSITRNVILHLRIACITASWQNFISWFLQIMISSVNADFQCDEFSNGESAMVNEGDCGHSYLALLRLKKIFGEKIFFPIESRRIVNGEDVPTLPMENGILVHAYPWMVRISGSRNAISNFCGGSLISRKHVMTAAHCMIHCRTTCRTDTTCCKKRSMRYVTLGDYHLYSKDKGEVQMEINAFITHPETHQPSPPNGAFLYDVALITLLGCVELGINIQPICIPKTNHRSYEGENVNVIGWGHLAYKESDSPLAGKVSNILKKITIKVLSDSICSKSPVYNYAYFMCAGDPVQWKKDACQDDSGGSYGLFVLGNILSCLYIITKY